MPQAEWTGEVGDSLRAIFTAPVPYLNQIEPIFDVLRVTERGFTGMVADHRNILKILVDPELKETTTAVQYDVTSDPQIVMTLQGPSDRALVKYLSENRENLVYALEKAERDRAVKANETYGNPGIESAILKTFGVEMKVPKGYTLAAQKPDFIWARNEYPTASQGFFIYSYPYEGKQSLTEEALVAARNKYAAQIPGPSEGSYMITSDAFAPTTACSAWRDACGANSADSGTCTATSWEARSSAIRPWTRPPTASSRSTATSTPRSEQTRKRNYMRGLEHLLYSVRFPGSNPRFRRATPNRAMRRNRRICSRY